MVYRFLPANLGEEIPIWGNNPAPPFSRRAGEKRDAGLPVEQCDIAAEISVDGEVVFPDIFGWSRGNNILSDRFRAALEAYAPGQVAYLPLNMRMPPHMKPAAHYYYMNVSARAQVMDWQRTPTRIHPSRRTTDGRPVIIVEGGTDSYVFRSRKPSDPVIWQETDLDTTQAYYQALKGDVFVTNALWQKLNADFPGQLNATGKIC